MKDLSVSPFNVPGNAVLEIAIVNSKNVQTLSGGVRAVGSSLERRFDLDGPTTNSGWDAVVMHVQADVNSQIEIYAENKSFIDFYLLGYWECRTYVEAFDTFTAGATGSWEDKDLSGYGVEASEIAEIIMTNDNSTTAREAGVRTNGSSLARRIDIQGADDSGMYAATMFVQADNTANATIEVYAEADADVDFYLLGYWEDPPGTYTELISDMGGPSSDSTWEDVELSGYGVPADAIAEVLLANTATTTENDFGVREKGSSIARLMGLERAETGGGANTGRMHAQVDSGSTIQFYHEDVSDTHTFWLTGYWEPILAVILADHSAGQETDAFSTDGSETDAELFGFDMEPCGPGTMTITELVFSLSSIAGLTNSDWADIELVVDDNGDGDIGIGETTGVGGTGVVDEVAGTITFSTSINVTAPTSYILRADFASLSEGDAVTITLYNDDIATTTTVLGTTSSVTHIVQGCYTPTFQTWTASTDATWETQDLSGAPYNVPANAIVEVAMVNNTKNNSYLIGVREVGSSLQRRLALDGPVANGNDVPLVMHVAADASSQIEHYTSSTGDTQFILLGYWECGTYVEAFDTFTAGASGAWQDVNMSAYGLSGAEVAEIVMTNDNNSAESEGGVRTNGSSFSRIVHIEEADDNGVTTSTMFVRSDGTTNATIEVYAEANGSIDFYLVGYWSDPPARYTEKYNVVTSPVSDATWTDSDLSSFGVPANAVAEFALQNTATTAPNSMGVRENGSLLARLLALARPDSGGANVGRMHVRADDASMVELYHEDVSDPHTFTLVGYWGSTPEQFIHWLLDGCSGATAADSSGSGNDGTLEPDASTGPQRTKRGRICGGLDFDGS
ncbi:MAG: hypothetical protein PVI86_17875, partial [Phycisphaerae bacterium]